mgnify:CR=1 FL=1|tara:strand:- start:312 stop:623 length:312 start_codon:yes stop_codon:yes gene_type:complete
MSISTSAISLHKSQAMEPCTDLDFCRDLNPRGGNIRVVQPPKQMVAGIPEVVGMGPSVPGLHGSSYSAASAANFMRLDTIDLGSVDPSRVANKEGIDQILNVQ